MSFLFFVMRSGLSFLFYRVVIPLVVLHADDTAFRLENKGMDDCDTVYYQPHNSVSKSFFTRFSSEDKIPLWKTVFNRRCTWPKLTHKTRMLRHSSYSTSAHVVLVDRSWNHGWAFGIHHDSWCIYTCKCHKYTSVTTTYTTLSYALLFLCVILILVYSLFYCIYCLFSHGMSSHGIITYL